MDGWVDGWMDGWMGGWINGGWMDAWMGGWMHEYINGQVNHLLCTRGEADGQGSKKVASETQMMSLLPECDSATHTHTLPRNWPTVCTVTHPSVLPSSTPPVPNLAA